MANFCFLVTLIVASLLVSPSLSLSSASSQLKKNTSFATISAAPTTLPDPPLSPYTELSPEIAPLLPSPAGSIIPTIPSNPSPPNPDEISSVGPADSAFAPSGSFPASSAMNLSLKGSLKLLKLSSFMTFLVMVHALAL